VRDTHLMIGIAYQTGDFGRKLKSHSSAFATCDASQLTWNWPYWTRNV